MPATQVAPYGSWQSPITSALIVKDAISLSQIAVDTHDIYWSEMRPSEGGRQVIVRQTPDGQTQDVTPAPFNARTRVHEYGGGAWAVHDGVIYFANFADQRLYRVDANCAEANGAPTPITPEPETPSGLRYADGVIDTSRQRLICVREDHTLPDKNEAVNTIVAIKLSANRAPDADTLTAGDILVSGHDFYAAPRLSPDGTQLAWVAWNHPHMPWTTTELWLADLNTDGSIQDAKCIAGGADESISQPHWSPDGVLYFVSDRTNWWNLYRWQHGQAQVAVEMAAEFAPPAWRLASSSYAFTSTPSALANQIVCTYRQNGTSTLAIIDLSRDTLTALDLPYTVISDIHVAGHQALFIAASPTIPSTLVQVDLVTKQSRELRHSRTVPVGAEYISIPRPIEFPTDNDQTAHAFFYPPRNQDFSAPADENPPLIVISHGGPTGATSNAFNLSIQYWTSRGFGVLDVNYGGSTGYGRAYRERLNGQWGIVDVADCTNGALYLAEQGVVDANRLIIRGGSAGGYTTLAALAFHDVFKAGASHFGVSDLEALAKETHKFESRYLDSLIGPYPARQDLYQERSPIHHAQNLSCPTIFFQGLEDKVVLPNQSEMMVDALRQKGVPVAYVAFAGEQHGFRQAQNIRRALDAELYFYATIFGFELAEAIEPVEIENF